MAILETDLDPFGDGSLLNSWTFNNKLTDEQGISTFAGTASYISGHLGNAVQSSTDLIVPATNVSGDVDVSINYWFRWYAGYTHSQGYHVFGGVDATSDRYAMTSSIYEYGEATTLQMKMHKNAYTASKVMPTPTAGWHMITYTYNSATDTSLLYYDGGQELSAVGQMKWIGGQEILIPDHTTQFPRATDQYMVFTKTLTQANITELLNMTEPTPHTAQPSAVSLSIKLLLDFEVIGDPPFSGIIVTDVPNIVITPHVMEEFGFIPIPYTAVVRSTEVLNIGLVHPEYVGEITKTIRILDLVQEIISQRAFIEVDIVQPIEQNKNAIIVKRS